MKHKKQHIFNGNADIKCNEYMMVQIIYYKHNMQSKQKMLYQIKLMNCDLYRIYVVSFSFCSVFRVNFFLLISFETIILTTTH